MRWLRRIALGNCRNADTSLDVVNIRTTAKEEKLTRAALTRMKFIHIPPD